MVLHFCTVHSQAYLVVVFFGTVEYILVSVLVEFGPYVCCSFAMCRMNLMIWIMTMEMFVHTFLSLQHLLYFALFLPLSC